MFYTLLDEATGDGFDILSYSFIKKKNANAVLKLFLTRYEIMMS